MCIYLPSEEFRASSISTSLVEDEGYECSLSMLEEQLGSVSGIDLFVGGLCNVMAGLNLKIVGIALA